MLTGSADQVPAYFHGPEVRAGAERNVTVGTDLGPDTEPKPGHSVRRRNHCGILLRARAEAEAGLHFTDSEIAASEWTGKLSGQADKYQIDVLAFEASPPMSA